MFRLRARTPFQDIRDPGMTHTYYGLSHAFPYPGLSTASPAFLDYSMVMLMLIADADSDADAGADADAVADL